MLDFNHSGALPGEAQIHIFVGKQHAGKTLHYRYFNSKTGKLKIVQSVTVDAYGYVTVRQSRCSSYVLTVHDTSDIPKIGDNSTPWLWWLLCGLSAAGAAMLVLLRTRKQNC